ncbi:MAG: hypothetical protein SGCHY_003202 [Lobulomycetales sp.]
MIYQRDDEERERLIPTRTDASEDQTPQVDILGKLVTQTAAKLIDISIAPQRQNLLDSELPSTKASVAPVAKELAKANNRDLVLKYRDRVSQALRSGFALKQEESLVHSF